jgi:glycosyltransferase involved in cell wall biosynthesis
MSQHARPPHPAGFPLVSFICETDADLMPHFVRWYRNLGVDRFHLIVHGPWDEANLAALAALPGVEITQRLHGTFNRNLKCDALTAVARRFVGEWIVIADADELLEMPFPTLAETAEALEKAGIDELYATLIQRVAADGSLPEVRPGTDLNALFPMFHVGLCEDMGLKLPAWRSKYPLARVGPDFVYQRGNHLPGNSRSVAHAPFRAVMHHFKWRSRLAEAFRRERGEGTNFSEMAVYRTWIETHGRLPMAGAKPCSRAALEAEGWLRRPDEGERATLRSMRQERETAAGRRLRVGFVTFELGGPGTANGGIATAISSLAKLQVAHGIEVEIFYCPHRHGLESWDPIWFEYWASFGVKLHFIPRKTKHGDSDLVTLEVSDAIVETVRKAGRFDLLHFHDNMGFAAPFGMLKAAGIDFTDTTIAITTHGGTRWSGESNGNPWDEEAYRQELIAQRLCDVLVSPSAYLIGWNRDLAALPERSLVLPNVLEPESKSFSPHVGRPVMPRCLAFFGRVEQRKGFDLFLEALRELTATTDLRPDVLILGRFGNGFSQERFDAETAGLPLRIEHHTSLNPQQALRLLKERTALAVMPSRLENSPYVAYEAMENQLPFLVSFTGGTAELVRREDWPKAELPMDPPAMARRFAEALRAGLQPARLTLDPLEIELKNLVTWRELAELGAGDRTSAAASRPTSELARYRLGDWRDATARDPADLVALVPEGVEVDDETLRVLASALLVDPSSDAIEGYATIIDEDLGTSSTSLHLLAKVTRCETSALAGPQPMVIRAGALAEIAPNLESSSDGMSASTPAHRRYVSLVRALERGGKKISVVPVQTHSHVFRPSLEGRGICERFWLPIGRKQHVERPARPRDQVWSLCALFGEDPYVALSTFSTDTPLGAFSLFPEGFRQQPSLHLITLGTSLLWPIRSTLPDQLAEVRKRWPLARVRVIASDEMELKALQDAQIPALLCNLNMFADEKAFCPRPADRSEPSLDAILVGALELRENHYLARLIPSLGLVHSRYDGMEDVGGEVRELLRQATYLNDTKDRPEGFFYPSNDQLARWICRASTGLALCQKGGACLPTVQYLLCGTPVVTVPNIGGRNHFLKAPYSITAEPNAESVAAAVAELKARQLPREEVHAATVRDLQAARARFLDDLNEVLRSEFGPGHEIRDLGKAIGGACRYQRAIDVLTEPPAGKGPALREAVAATPNGEVRNRNGIASNVAHQTAPERSAPATEHSALSRPSQRQANRRWLRWIPFVR